MSPSTTVNGSSAPVTHNGQAALPPPSHPGKLGVLRHRHFRNILIANFVSNIGSWMEMFGIQYLVAEKTGSLADLGTLAVFQLTPILVMGLVGGLLADRVNRKRLLITTQIMLMILAGCMAAVSAVHFDNVRTLIHWLFLLGALNGIVMAFNMPAWQVVTPRLVPKEELTAAVTLNGIGFNLARVIGPAGAGFLMGFWGVTPLLIFNTLTFLGVVATVATTPDAPAPPRDNRHVLHQVRAAAAFIFTERGPRAVFLAMTGMSIFAAPLVRLLALFVIDVYHQADESAKIVGGNLLALQGLGAVVGGLSLRVIPAWYPKHHLIPLAIVCVGIAITAFAGVPLIVPGYFIMFFIGVFWMIAFNQSWAGIQVLTPDDIRGRVMSVANVSSFGATALGVGVAGWLGESVKDHNWLDAAHSTQLSLLVLSVPLLITGIVMLIYRTPEVDGLPRGGPPGLGRRSLLEGITASAHRPPETEVEMPTGQ